MTTTRFEVLSPAARVCPVAPAMAVDPADFTPRALHFAEWRSRRPRMLADLGLDGPDEDLTVEQWLRRELLIEYDEFMITAFADHILFGEGRDGTETPNLTGILGHDGVTESVFRR